MKIAIIGNSHNKFTNFGYECAKEQIVRILSHYKPEIVISGHCHLGGIDIWVEQIARALGYPLDLKIPKQLEWDNEYGFKQRNIDIAKSCDMLFCIVVNKYPYNYEGIKFNGCYHDNLFDHVKSGACWTLKYTQNLNKFTQRIIVKNEY